MTKFEVFSNRYQELSVELEDALEYSAAVPSEFALNKVIDKVVELSNLRVPTNSKLKV